MTPTRQHAVWRGVMEADTSGNKGRGMTSRGDGAIDPAALHHLTHRLGEGASPYAPAAHDPNEGLPGRTRGAALNDTPPMPVGPRAIILDCGTSRMPGFTHVFLIAHGADALLGSHTMDSLAPIVGRIAGVESLTWEGADRLHVHAPGLEWEDLLREAQDAVAEYLAGS